PEYRLHGPVAQRTRPPVGFPLEVKRLNTVPTMGKTPPRMLIIGVATVSPVPSILCTDCVYAPGWRTVWPDPAGRGGKPETSTRCGGSRFPHQPDPRESAIPRTSSRQ